MEGAVARHQGSDRQPNLCLASDGILILPNELPWIFRGEPLFAASENSLIQFCVPGLHGAQIHQCSIDNRHGAEQLGMLESQVGSSKPAHGKSLDETTLATLDS